MPNFYLFAKLLVLIKALYLALHIRPKIQVEIPTGKSLVGAKEISRFFGCGSI